MDYNLETPFVGDFGTIEVLYSLDNGTNWYNALAANSSNFTPSTNCQILSHTVTTGYITSLNDFRVKFKFLHNTGDWEAIIDDFKIDLTPTSASTPSLDLANLSVYPNPVTDMLNIDYKENISNLTVYDLSGRLVKSFTTNNSNKSIDVSGLTSGTYLLKIETESKNVSTMKFIKR